MKPNSVSRAAPANVKIDDLPEAETLIPARGRNERPEIFGSLPELRQPPGDRPIAHERVRASTLPRNFEGLMHKSQPLDGRSVQPAQSQLHPGIANVESNEVAAVPADEIAAAPDNVIHDVAIQIGDDVSTHEETRDHSQQTASKAVGNLGKNVLAALAARAPSVFVPTLAREAVRSYLTPAISALPANAATGIGATAALLPAAANFIGLARDIRNGTGTKTSIISRSGLMLANVATASVACATGSMAAAAPAIIAANLVYTPLRDAVQHYVGLTNNLKDSEGFEPKPTGLSAAAYAVNQGLVNEGMTQVAGAATRSFGAAATAPLGISETTQSLGDVTTHREISLPSGGYVGARSAGFAAANLGGEVLDDLTSNYLTAWNQGKASDLQLSVGLVPENKRTWSNIAERAFTTNAARSTLFSSVYSNAYSLPSAATESVGGNHVIEDLVVGATMGILYPAFVGSGFKKQQAQVPDEETGISNLASTPSGSRAIDEHWVENETSL
ncbi:hypothetical protein ACV22V_31850 [Burkholderia sp. AW33-5]